MKGRSQESVIRFGSDSRKLLVPAGEFAARLEPLPISPRMSPEEIVRQALEAPHGCARLRDIARGKRTAAVLVPGKDRVAGADTYLPLLLDELNAGGIADEHIEAFLATGTHAKHSTEEAVDLLGQEATSRIRWTEHDCLDEAGLVNVGLTSYGTQVSFNRGVLDADVKVLTGRIIPHYFAGFGGGRKALLPGVAGFRSILDNHRLTLHRQEGIHPAVRPCRLAGNPVHLDMLEAAHMVDGVFVLNTLLNTEHQIIGAFAGELAASHAAGCAEAEGIFQVNVPEPLDALITSAGGTPYDCNFMQALKALFNVQEMVRPGGAVLWVAECPGGIKNGFLRWGPVELDRQLEREVRLDYDLTGHNSIMLRRLLRKVRIALWSTLPDDEVRTMGIEPTHSLDEGVEWLSKTCRKNFRYGVIPFANVTYATTR